MWVTIFARVQLAPKGNSLAPIRPSEYTHTFSQKTLSDLRQKLCLTQAELAALLDVPVNTLSRWETGKTTPDAHALAALYSTAAERGVTPQFFIRRKDPMTARRYRTKRVVMWDFQNLDLKAEDVVDEWNWMHRYLDLIHPKTRSSQVLRAYTSTTQWQAAQALQQTGFEVFQGYFDADSQIEADSIELCAKNPHKTAFILVSNDGDYGPLLRELRENGVEVYIWGTDESNEHLRVLVGQDHFINWDVPYVVVTAVDVIKEQQGKPVTLGDFGIMCRHAFDQDDYGIYPEEVGFSRKRPYRSLLRHLELKGIVKQQSVGGGSGNVSITLNRN